MYPIHRTHTHTHTILLLVAHTCQYINDRMAEEPAALLYAVLGLKLLELLPLPLQGHALGHLVGLPVQDDEVAAEEVEAGQVLAGLLGVVDILVDDVRRAAGLLAGAPTVERVRGG